MKQVNIIIGRFQPMTKGHMKCIEQAYKGKHVPTVICMIDTKDEKVDERHPFPSSMMLPLYEDIFKNNKYVEKIILVRNANIVEIGETLYKENYEIVSWTCGTDRIDSYSKMASKYAEQAHLATNFSMLEIKRSDEDESATKLRAALQADDRKTFLAGSVEIPLHTHLKQDYFELLREQLLKVYNK